MIKRHMRKAILSLTLIFFALLHVYSEELENDFNNVVHLQIFGAYDLS